MCHKGRIFYQEWARVLFYRITEYYEKIHWLCLSSENGNKGGESEINENACRLFPGGENLSRIWIGKQWRAQAGIPSQESFTKRKRRNKPCSLSPFQAKVAKRMEIGKNERHLCSKRINMNMHENVVVVCAVLLQYVVNSHIYTVSGKIYNVISYMQVCPLTHQVLMVPYYFMRVLETINVSK